jgi:hypothetical protein
MSLTHSRDSLKSAVGEDPVRGAAAEEPASGPRSVAHRLHDLLWVLVCCFLCLVVAVLLLFRQAVQHQLVEADLDAAAAAFDAARRAQAHEHAPEAWGKAANAMAAAMAELHRQHGRFVLLRGYPRVHELLIAAIQAAENAKASAEAVTAQADGQRRGGIVAQGWASVGGGVTSHDAAVAVSAAKAALDHAVKLFCDIERCSRARQPKEVRLRLETIRGNLDAYKAQIFQLDDKYARGLLAEAMAHADTLKGQIDPLCNDLEAILVKFKCNR